MTTLQIIGLIIYLIGSAWAYRRMRKTWINNFGYKYEWSRVFVCLLAYIMSYIGVFLALCLDDDTKVSIKPPKWL